MSKVLAECVCYDLQLAIEKADRYVMKHFLMLPHLNDEDIREEYEQILKLNDAVLKMQRSILALCATEGIDADDYFSMSEYRILNKAILDVKKELIRQGRKLPGAYA